MRSNDQLAKQVSARATAALCCSLVAGLFGATASLAQTICPGSDSILLDCNGNGTDDVCDIGFFFTSADADSNGIPDECDGEICFDIASGFEPAPPFDLGTPIDGIDLNGDGEVWSNPSGSWTIANQGCPAGAGRALKGVAQTPPISNEFLQSESFHADAEGRLSCTSAKYRFAADLRYEAGLNPRIDWQIMLRDGTNNASVVLIHLPSTQSTFTGVGTNRGRMLVRNPDNPNAFLTLSPTFVLSPNTCFRVEVELDNTAPAASAVKLYVNGTLRLSTKRLSSSAARMDYLFIQQVANNQASGGVNRLAIDNLSVCEQGPVLDWPDCNDTCVSDLVEVAAGTATDCDANAVPDECQPPADCNTNGVQDVCDIAFGTSQDCDSNGVPNECDPDCNTNGVPDGCDLAAGTSTDCNANGRLDVCDAPPDFNDDRIIHTADWIALVARFTGPDLPEPCPLVDLDADGDVDLADAAAFQALESGPDTDGDRIADLYETDDGVYVSPTATGTNPAVTDTDLDGLGDGDEVLGTPAGLDLPTLGASPLRRDIFVEADWTDDAFDGGPHSHRPTPEGVAAIVDAFAGAPVTNPYGGPNGVSLHVDYGQGGTFTGGNLIPGSPPFIVWGSGFNGLKAVHFAPERNGYFHYSIFSHAYNSAANGSSGFAELPGDDFMVTLGGVGEYAPWVSKTMMHELGHNLGLGHGGDENLNQKPNYNSVMNYRFQFNGADVDCDAWGDEVIDYSRGLLGSLDESHLNECEGTCGPGSSIDWNFSGGPCETDLAWNITEGEDGDGFLSMLHDYDDWSHLDLSTLSDGDRAAPEIITCMEVPR